MTNEEFEEFQRATDPLKPLAAAGHYAGLDGLASGAAALLTIGASTALDLPLVAAYPLAAMVAYLTGRSIGAEHWRKYNRACDRAIEHIRQKQQ